MLKNLFFLLSLFFALNIQNNQNNPRLQRVRRRLYQAIDQLRELRQRENHLRRIGRNHLDTCCCVAAACTGGLVGVGMAAAIASLYFTPNTRPIRQLSVSNLGQLGNRFK